MKKEIETAKVAQIANQSKFFYFCSSAIVTTLSSAETFL
jgi:hypothetical protein